MIFQIYIIHQIHLEFWLCAKEPILFEGFSNTGTSFEVADIEISTAKAIKFKVPEMVDVYKSYKNCVLLSIENIDAHGDHTIVWCSAKTSETISVCPDESTTYSSTVINGDGFSVTK